MWVGFNPHPHLRLIQVKIVLLEDSKEFLVSILLHAMLQHYVNQELPEVQTGFIVISHRILIFYIQSVY